MITSFLKHTADFSHILCRYLNYITHSCVCQYVLCVFLSIVELFSLFLVSYAIAIFFFSAFFFRKKSKGDPCGKMTVFRVEIL